MRATTRVLAVVVLTAVLVAVPTLVHLLGCAAADSSTSSTGLVSEAVRVYEDLYGLSLHGVDVSQAVEELNKGLQCIGVNASCALSHIAAASQLASSLGPEGGSGLVAKALLAVAALSLPVLTWFGLPLLYVIAWGLARRDWVLEEHGTSLWEYTGGLRLRRLAEVYRLVDSGELALRDPRPPRDFIEYLGRPGYSMWLWTGLVLAAIAAALALTSTSALHPLRLVLGLVYVFFLPGYGIAEALYPGEELSPIEHLALSIGLSLAIVPLGGLLLNYTPWHVTQLPVIGLIFLVIAVSLLVAAYRKYMLYEKSLVSEEH